MIFMLRIAKRTSTLVVKFVIRVNLFVDSKKNERSAQSVVEKQNQRKLCTALREIERERKSV